MPRRQQPAKRGSKQSSQMPYAILAGVGALLVVAIGVWLGLRTTNPPAPTKPDQIAGTAPANTQSENKSLTTVSDVPSQNTSNTQNTGSAVVTSSTVTTTSQSAPSQPAAIASSTATAPTPANEGQTPGAPAAAKPEITATEKSKSQDAEIDLSNVIDRIGRSVVLIRLTDSNGQNTGLGSGFVISKDGLIATNFHVMESAASAEAEFRDGTRFNISGYRAHDEKRDIAIVQLESPPADLEPLEFADSSDVRQGSSVIAVGHPRGLRFTATEGIVSAIHKTSELPPDLRRHMESPDDQIWIQTNATIFSGNSGGPLLSRSGKVVGMNSWITRDVNFGFALAVQHLSDLKVKVTEAAIPLAEVNRQSSGHDPKRVLGTLAPGVKTVLDEYQRSREEFHALLSLCKTNEEREKLTTMKNPARQFAPRLVKIATDSPKSTEAYQALIYAVTLLRQYHPESTATSQLQQVTTQLVRDHIDETSLGIAALILSESRLPCVQRFLKDLLQSSPHRDAQGIACFVLGRLLGSSENAVARKDSIKHLERVVNEFSDVLVGDQPLIDSAQKMLFELQHLSIGTEAPEIVGKDIDGNEIKLSDFRGKVVMLDFFVNWCPYCTQMYPLERILVERSRDQPCVLLGVNCDKESVLRNIIDDKKVTWQCWADGQEGPIAREWQISGYPAVYLIDHEGIIRYRSNGVPDSGEIDKLLTQMTKKANEAKGKAKNRNRTTR
ncbi:trypsin-like peptidase domain-containing protein [Schlesneria paludicola]|uniref:trypsin-like peptidase domain-containing protein n=1 Tax=Schlesneria paludicola TaxID=360056 RepID=UPI001ED94BBC|nr:trypsin-like peptidase domain-containing protein [Schlesneria paludicola]